MFSVIRACSDSKKLFFFVWAIIACSYTRKKILFSIRSTQIHVFRSWHGEKPWKSNFLNDLDTIGLWILVCPVWPDFYWKCYFRGNSPQESNFWDLKSANMFRTRFSFDCGTFHLSISMLWYRKLLFKFTVSLIEPDQQKKC